MLLDFVIALSFSLCLELSCDWTEGGNAPKEEMRQFHSGPRMFVTRPRIQFRRWDKACGYACHVRVSERSSVVSLHLVCLV